MKKIYRTLFLGTVILVLLTSACAEVPDQGTAFPTLSDDDLTGLPPIGGTDTTPAVGTTGTPAVGTTGTAAGAGTTGTPAAGTTGTPAVSTTGTAAIPITGLDVNVMCEFCLEDVAHAIVAVPEGTTFTSTLSDSSADADLTCYSVETTAGQQLVICYGTVLAGFDLNICDANNNCVDVPLTLMDCPAAAPGGADTGTPAVTGTGTPSTGTTTTPSGATTTPAVLGTPTATP